MATVRGASTATAVQAEQSTQDQECAEDTSAADEKAVRSGLTYNNPDTAGRDDIAEHIIGLICDAEPESTIYMAAHLFAHRGISQALYDMSQREVTVQVIVDRGAELAEEEKNYTEYFWLAKRWIENPQGDSWIRLCDLEFQPRACIGGGLEQREDAKMHNKFLLFSKTRGTEKVVVQTSHNFKEGGSGTGMWNSAYTVADEPRVYDHYREYFGDLIANKKQDDYYNVLSTDPLGKYRVYHSPRVKGNTLYDILDRVDCTKASDTGGTNPGHRPIVRVAVWNASGDKWDSTGTYLTRKLKHMDDQGCYVDFVVDDIGRGAGGHDGPLEALLRKPKSEHHGPEVREFYAESSKGGLHSKDILIDGYFDDKPNQKVVFTGTFNFTWKSVRVNDETQLQINDAAVHDAYRDYFFEVRDAASLTWQTSKYTGGNSSSVDISGELDCNETEQEYHGKGYVYFYGREKCAGAHGASDNSGGDRDHGDDQEQIQNWDNNTDSIVNTTNSHIEFYNYPQYNETPAGQEKGDRFCLGPGEWINALQYYGDADGTKDWWRNSISSHRKVSAERCTRWFGWGTNRG
ncbi:phospholipase D-like domain-containing protein [Actinophytocola sediminis]